MKKSLSLSRFIVGLAVVSASFIANAAEYGPMNFEFFTPCSGNGSMCYPRILAQGYIESDTPEKLRIFLKGSEPGRTTVVFDSPGGNLMGGVQLGLLIRALEFDTAVLEAVEEENREDIKTIVAKPICASACSLAFLGGITRTVDKNARFGVHQFASPSAQLGDSGTQVVMTSIASYVQLMGVKRNFMDLASLTSPDKMYWLNAKEIKSLQVDNSSPELSAWEIEALGNGIPIVTVMQDLSPEKKLMLMLSNHPRGVKLTILNIVPTSFDVSYFPIGEPANVKLITDNKQSINPINLSGWQPVPGPTSRERVLQAIVLLSPDDVEKLSIAKKLSILDAIPNVIRQLQFSTDLSVENLRNGLQLLRRVQR